MYCKKCGAELRDGAIFCPKCGEKVALYNQKNTEIDIKNKIDTSATADTAMIQKEKPVVNNIGPEEQTNKRSNKKILGITIGLIAVVAIAAIVVVIINNSETPEEKAYREGVEAAKQIQDSYSDILGSINEAASDAVSEFESRANEDNQETETQIQTISASEATAEAQTYETETVDTITTQALEEINPFTYITAYFSGIDGYGTIEIESNNPFFMSSEFFIIDANNGYLSNGDNVHVRFDEEAFTREYSGYNVTRIDGYCTVSGLTAATTSAYEPLPESLRTYESSDYMILPDASWTYYNQTFIESMTNEQLRYARNEICAYAGRAYSIDSSFYSYFSTKPWYDPIYDGAYFDLYIDSIINVYEKYNLDLINFVESNRGATN